MNITTNNSMLTGIKAIVSYKDQFKPEGYLYNLNSPSNKFYTDLINQFVQTFCRYELADNDYMSIQLETMDLAEKNYTAESFGVEKVLKYLTYIIWTDKFADNYFLSKIKDNTVYTLLKKLEEAV